MCGGVEDTIVGSDTSGILSFGARALFNGRLSIGPTLSVPVEKRDGDIMFGFSLTVGLGG